MLRNAMSNTPFIPAQIRRGKAFTHGSILSGKTDRSWVSSQWYSTGQAFYGYGSMVAAATTFLLAFVMLLRELPWLHYHAFITNNTSLGVQLPCGKAKKSS
jgi:hypothetical protein